MSSIAIVRLAAVLALALCLVPSSQAFPSPATSDVHHLQARDLSASLQSCLTKSGATLVYPNASTYGSLSRAENTNYVGSAAPHPQVIVQPSSSAQIASVIKCVNADGGNTKISPRGGGHGYAAYSLSGQVVLDSSKMTSIKIDAANKQATIGFGQKLGHVAQTLGAQGFALPHGTCPQVGVAGHSLGGGWGYTSRKWGWLVDHIVAIQLVDATGTVKTINAQSTGADADLWWAMRGAGSNNFGVVTHFTYALQAAPSVMTNYAHTYGSNADCAKVLLALQSLLSSSKIPNELGGELLMYGENSGSDGACSLSGMYFGNKSAYKTVMKTVNDAVSAQGVTATKATATEFDNYLDALTNIMGDLSQDQVYEPYYAQSIVDDGAPSYTPQSATAIVNAVQAAVGAGGAGNSISFDFNGAGSVTNANPTTGDMSFNHRNAMFFSQIYSYAFPGFDKPQAQSSALSKINAITQAVRNAKPNGDWHAYQNYIDPNLQNFGTAYYGSNLDRLKSIKKTADPKTIFDFPQGLAHA
jgi:hypothetical protein